MSREILTYWLPLIAGAVVIGVLLVDETFLMVGICGVIWGLIYGTFYYYVLVPIYKKIDEDDKDKS